MSLNSVHSSYKIAILSWIILDNKEITERTHGNAKSKYTIFRPIQYSLKKQMTATLNSTRELPRIILTCLMKTKHSWRNSFPL